MKRWLWLLCALPIVAHAQIFRCKGADGKTQLSDRPCTGAAEVTVVKERSSYVSEEDQYNARLRTARMQGELQRQDDEKAAAIANHDNEQRRREAATVTAKTNETTTTADAEAVAACVKDVERRGATQNVKAEMIAACRTAGMTQRASGISSEAVRSCVRDVERTGASEREKARQLATCHGGDVRDEPVQVVVKKPPPQLPSVMKSCFNGQCSDQYGNRFRKDIMGNFETSDGRRCRQHGNELVCD